MEPEITTYPVIWIICTAVSGAVMVLGPSIVWRASKTKDLDSAVASAFVFLLAFLAFAALMIVRLVV